MTTQKLWFIFHNTEWLLQHSPTGTRNVPCSVAAPLPVKGTIHTLGLYNGMACMAYETPDFPSAVLYTRVGLRASYDLVDSPLYALAGKAAELIHWDAYSTYCPFCGTPTAHASAASKRCPACGNELFPSISTAILALVRKDDSILLAHGCNFKASFHSLIAGFLEVGESLEECVQREVFEETGLSVGSIRYFGSQPWPYPSGLMVGFIADYCGGEILLQKDELDSAQFFHKESMPLLPHTLSLSRRMIDWWLNQTYK